MSDKQFLGFSDGDVRFLVETVAPQLLDRLDLIKGDADLIRGMLTQDTDRVFQRIINTRIEEIMTSISPRFLFEVLLRKAASDLRVQSYTVEKAGSQKVPVFDAKEVVKFLTDEMVIQYLADMLSSFTKTENFTVAVRVRKGIWRKFRFSDMDVDSLIRLCEKTDEEHRFALYKRTADLCLFILGIFPECVVPDYRPSLSEKEYGRGFKRLTRSAMEYEEKGRWFYKLASSHRDAEILGLSEVLYRLHEKFDLAKKPLIHISENLLKLRKQKLFPPLSPN